MMRPKSFLKKWLTSTATMAHLSSQAAPPAHRCAGSSGTDPIPRLFYRRTPPTTSSPRTKRRTRHGTNSSTKSWHTTTTHVLILLLLLSQQPIEMAHQLQQNRSMDEMFSSVAENFGGAGTPFPYNFNQPAQDDIDVIGCGLVGLGCNDTAFAQSLAETALGSSRTPAAR